MDFKVELCKKLSDDFRLMADIYFSSNSTNISLYFSEVVDNANENTINEIIEFLTNVVNIKRNIEESNVFQKDNVKDFPPHFNRV